MKKHNFFAGPSILPQFTIDETIKGIQDFEGTGLSVLEISHRSKQFVAVVDEATNLFKELLNNKLNPMEPSGTPSELGRVAITSPKLFSVEFIASSSGAKFVNS